MGLQHQEPKDETQRLQWAIEKVVSEWVGEVTPADMISILKAQIARIESWTPEEAGLLNQD